MSRSFSAAAAKKLVGNRRQWLKNFKDLLKKFLSFEKFSHKKTKNDNRESFHKKLDEKNYEHY
jgi:hypothetical protein